MKNKAGDIAEIVNLFAAQREIKDLNTLIQLSHSLFEKKITIIEKAMTLASSQQERDILKEKAITLYKEYKQSLKVMENYINEIERTLAL